MKQDYHQLLNQLVFWMQKVLQSASAQGFVYGVSGGVDSAVVCAIATRYFPQQSLALRMDLNNHPDDVADANLVINHFQANHVQVNLAAVLQTFATILPDNPTALANLKSRLRMNTLYYYAQHHNYLVCGTGNAAEIHMGYFTKYGDGACDFAPLANFTKTAVWQLANHLSVPTQIITKAPTAGLHPNQTDEKEMGITYQEIDAYLQNQPVSAASATTIHNWHTKNAHKQQIFKTLQPIGKILA